MNEQTVCLVITPDGRQRRVPLPRRLLRTDGIEAPTWLVSLLELRGDAHAGWRLRVPLSGGEHSRLTSEGPGAAVTLPTRCVVRAATAGAGRTAFDPRQARLKKERRALEKLNAESDYVRVEPQNVLEGSEPEEYKVTFRCRGITGVDASRRPVYGDEHVVHIRCDDEFPSDVPQLQWKTSIWHPNIQHDGAKGVCVNKAEWLGGMGLDDLVRLMFEMVQYKNYHAEMTPPYPLDQEAATWVRDYAEPAGVVDKKRNISVDDKPFTRPTEAGYSPTSAGVTSRIKLLTPTQTSTTQTSRIRLLDPSKREDAPPSSDKPRIKILKTE
jgi:ubiquitin-protein ligase